MLNLRDVSALVASLQQTGDEVPKKVQVLFGHSFLQLLDRRETLI